MSASTAVVILNYNGRALLEKFLPSVVAFSSPARVIVADNASTDDSLPWLEKNYPQVERIAMDQNRGFCGGYNTALKMVKADRYVLLNSDVEVTPGWLVPLEEVLDQYPDVAAVQPKVLAERQRDHFEYAGAAGGLLDTLGYPFCRGRIFYHTEKDEGQYDDERAIFWSSGACMMIRSAWFHRLGGLDEDFFAHMEEIDLCWRLQRAGQKVYYTHRSQVFHVGGATLQASNPRKTYYNFRNGLSLIYSNLPAGELVFKFPIRLALDWVASFKFMLAGTVRDGLAVLRAHAHFFRNFKREVNRRRRSAELGYTRPATQYSGWVVWDFFILGKRKAADVVD
ncbi:MAG: glycosyltransferase family 2 protein [Cyclobacteriaceae bacterium]|nr:glycosyltransferase family 2 protein [Cyclobacteriaceae bacterium]